MEGFTSRNAPAGIPIYRITGSKQLASWLTGADNRDQAKFVQQWATASNFTGRPNQVLLVPGKAGELSAVLVGVDEQEPLWQLAKLPAALPKGKYRVADCGDPALAERLCLGWGLGTYSFDRYKKKAKSFATLTWPEKVNKKRVQALLEATRLGRDLINTPAEDMGPDNLAAEARRLAQECGADYRELVGDELLQHNYPSIHAVGRAASRPPRLIDFKWGSPKAAKVTLVGKGVCFDTGGLDLKPADAMKLMKKDMGGAACVLAVASVVMKLNLPVRLRVLIPAVENSVAGNAFRPLDVLATRKGMSVEVGHTDAEGRLVLSDALTEADAEKPDLLIDVATLTGAARVALGTGMPALFSSSDTAAQELLEAGLMEDDPLWRMPLHKPYRKLLDSRVADISNVSSGPYAGAITAALFLQEFVSEKTPWMHIDTMAFNLESLPGRPYGGEMLGVRALVRMLERRYAKNS